MKTLNGSPRSSRFCVLAILLTAMLASCGESTGPTGVATNPVAPGGTASTPGGSVSPANPAGVRTVLSPLGLNIHSDPAVTAAKLGTASQGAVLTVLEHSPQNGGWYRVQGQTLTGWITADPTLTAAGRFQQYQASDRNFNALYPQDWTFAATVTDVVFHPLSGPETIDVRNAAHVADFGPSGGPGLVGAGQQTVVVCGVTGDLNEYTRTGPPSTQAPGTPAGLGLLAQLRLRLDAGHALALEFNYSKASDLDVFSAFYNSMTFPFPQCQQTPSASPSPT